MYNQFHNLLRTRSVWVIGFSVYLLASGFALANEASEEFATIRGALSGSWYDPSRDGEGFVFELSEIPSGTVATVYWFTHKDNEPYWLIGSTEYDPEIFNDVGLLEFDLLEVSGTGFGEDFDSDDLIQNPRGAISFVFEDCSSAVGSWTPESGSDHLGTDTLEYDLERITMGLDSVDCTQAQDQTGSGPNISIPPMGGVLSGSWFDPKRNGEGFVLEFGKIPDSNMLTVYWFTHKDGKPYWLIGAAPYPTDELQLDMELLEVSGTGFGADFVSDDLTRSEWGDITLGFVDCNEAMGVWESLGGTGTFDLQRITKGLDGAICASSTNPNSNFYLASNGVTVMCPQAAIGESGWVNGVLYTKRSRDQITTKNAEKTCTSGIADMGRLFYKKVAFNQDIGSWDTGSVIFMNEMFSDAISFNQDIGGWNTSLVDNMSRMFYKAESFNHNISSWDTAAVRNMNEMFRRASAFNQPLDRWNVSSATIMSGMFSQSLSFNQPLGSWDVSSVVFLDGMFSDAPSFNQPLNKWDVSSVIDMSTMFSGARDFDQPLESWNVSSVKDMSWMFSYTSSFNQPLADWNTQSVTEMHNMFSNSESFNQPIESWDVSSVTDMSGMFNQTLSFNQPLGSWDTSSVVFLDGMFFRAEAFNQPLNNWDTSLVKRMNAMFLGAASFDQPLDKWDVSAAASMERMFQESKAFNQDLSDWCVERFSDKPINFDKNTPAWTLPKPNWGAPCQ